MGRDILADRDGYAAPSAPRPWAVRQKTLAAVERQRDELRPGRPITLLFAGGAGAVVCLGVAIYIAYRAYYLHTLAVSTSWAYLAPIAVLYVVLVFLFSYAYQLYDLKKALLLTAGIVFFGIFVVVLVAALFAFLSAADDLPGGNGSGSGSGSSGTGGEDGGLLEKLKRGEWHVPFWSNWGSDQWDLDVYQRRCRTCGRTFAGSDAIEGGRCPHCGSASLD